MVSQTSVPQTVGSDAEGGVSSFQGNILQITYVVMGCLGLLGNTFVISVLLSNRTIRKKVPNIYLINQGMLDAVSSLLIITFALTASNGANLSGYADDLLCRLWLTRFPIWSMLVNSSYSLLVLTIDRYVRIVHPVNYKNYFNKNKQMILLAATWIIGPLYNISWKWPTSGIIDGKCLSFAIWPNNTTASIVGILTITLEYILPLTVLIFCYTKIILAIRKRIKPKPTSDGGTITRSAANSKPNNFKRAKNNTVKILISVAVLCWTCNQIFFFLYFVGYPTDFGSHFYHFTVVAVFSNCCINPFIYCANYEDFHVALRELFCKSTSDRETPIPQRSCPLMTNSGKHISSSGTDDCM